MRNVRKLTALTAAIVVALSLTAAAPALADPPSGTVPRPADAVGVGANTTEYLLDQLAGDYDAGHAKSSTLLYSWDATNPVTGAIGDEIETKADCPGISRPDGTGAGISALDANVTDPESPSHYCIDYARASSGRTAADPPYAAGGIAFVALAGDAVTWADRDAVSGGTDAPANLTTAQLVKIYECTDTNWDQVGGKNAPIEAFLPQTSSGTRSFWLTALGGGSTPITPGSCVSDLPTEQYPGGTLEENEGVNPALNSPEAVFIYSVGDYISQVYYSAACLNSGCTPNGSGVVCAPTKSQNQFGCDVSGVLQLNKLNNMAPLNVWPAPPHLPPPTINHGFDLLFQRTLYDVVRFDPNTTDHIPGAESGAPGAINLEQFFGADGYACTSAEARTAIKHYGFLATWKLGTCGATD
jgi:ABC-type phosphate transport system substrate-binding protein